MRVSAYLMILASAPLALTACGSEDETEMPMNAETMPMAGEDMPMNAGDMPMARGDMPMMGPDAEMQMANAEGTVTAVDQDAGTITIDHGPVPAVDWPAMVMTFEADEAILDEVAVGDEVMFGFRMAGSRHEITSIEQR